MVRCHILFYTYHEFMTKKCYLMNRKHFYDQVSETSRNMEDSSSQNNKKLLKDLSNMLQISKYGKHEVNEYIERAKTRFTEDTFSSTENRAVMENCLEEW